MGEVIFVAKCFVMTAALTLAMQLRWGQETLEDKIQQEIKASPAVHWIQSVASGGALFIDRTTTAMSRQIDQWMGASEEASQPQRAGRSLF